MKERAKKKECPLIRIVVAFLLVVVMAKLKLLLLPTLAATGIGCE